MPSWDDLLREFSAQQSDDAKSMWIQNRSRAALGDIARLRGGRHVIFYGSGFLQNPRVPAWHQMVTHEDMNGFMSTIYGMEWQRGLTLLIHTPGGDPNAAESIVNYLRQKFGQMEIIVPTLAMSAGTMMALASDRIVMGRQSQLGPIDPRFTVDGQQMSARAIVEQFEQAQREIMADREQAHVWAAILARVGPALLQEAQNALAYSETMVARWLSTWMLKDAAAGERVAKHFNDASTHKSHGRRIGREEAAQSGVVVEDLEANQDLQEAVLTLYHVATIMFEQTHVTKLILSDHGRSWMKNFTG